MAWPARSRRRTELPRDWPAIRRAVLERDAWTCTINGPRCTTTATDVDHTGAPDDHSPTSLRSACRTCHMGRTAAQAHATRPTLRRQPTRHPGLL